MSCTVVSFNDENVDFFFEKNEQAVAEWCRKNHKQAGRGTDTLREAKAIYFPIQTTKKTFVVAFSCNQTKFTVTDKLILAQIINVLTVVL